MESGIGLGVGDWLSGGLEVGVAVSGRGLGIVSGLPVDLGSSFDPAVVLRGT